MFHIYFAHAGKEYIVCCKKIVKYKQNITLLYTLAHYTINISLISFYH